MPGTVLGAKDTAVNKRNPNRCSHGACILIGAAAVRVMSKLYSSLEGDKC